MQLFVIAVLYMPFLIDWKLQQAETVAVLFTIVSLMLTLVWLITGGQ